MEMVVSSVAPVALNESECLSTEVVNLPEQMECVDGKLIEKTGMTFKHSVTQANVTRNWGNTCYPADKGEKSVQKHLVGLGNKAAVPMSLTSLQNC
jgi:hypothetical protein